MANSLWEHRNIRNHRKNYGRNSVESGNKIITLIIYILTCYILFNLMYSGLGKFASKDLLLAGIKRVSGNNLLYVDYIVKEDRNILTESSRKKDFMKIFFNNPASDYYEKKVPINVAEVSSVNFCLSNSVIMRGKELSDNENNLRESNDVNKILDNEINKEIESINNSVNNTDNENSITTDNQEVNNNISGDVMGYIKKKDIKTEELTYDYLMSKFYTVVSGTTLYPTDIDSAKLMNIDMKLTTPSNKPQILIYHTHAEEGFSDSISGDKNTGIVGVGNYLTEILMNQYGYNVIHISDSFDLRNGVLDRSKAYDYAYERVAQVLAENPSIEVVLDLHRDGVNENLHMVTNINGKQTAKIMFFNGISRLNSIGEIGYLYNPYREQNLAMSLHMKVLAEEYFEGFTRKNYIQAYQYNLHLRPKSMLIEVGAQTNSLQEAKNAMEPLAFLLNQTLCGME